MVRALHFTDVHVVASLAQVPLRDWFGKRLLGAANAIVRRNARYREAVTKLGRLADFVREEGIDLVLCTGDYTMFGTEAEFALAREALAPLLEAKLGYVHVPGNHDLYVPDTVREQRFERAFAGTLWSDLPEHQVDGSWPLVRWVGDDVAVVAVSSARPNPQPWRSSGRVSPAQLTALRQILADPRVRDRFVFLLTHYAPRLADGSRDHPLHGLENIDDFLAACRPLQRGALLHGHVHRCFELKIPELNVPIFDAGSTTCAGREGFWVFEVEAARASVTRGHWDGQAYRLDSTTSHPL